MARLDFNSDNVGKIKEYFFIREKQLRGDGFFLSSMEVIPKVGVLALFQKKEKTYQSLYVFNKERKKGKYLKNIKKEFSVLTTKDCGIVDFLKKKEVKHVVAGKIFESKEYKLIKEFYGDRKAKRSQVYLMNHIDEGVSVLQSLGASKKSMKAFMIHPLYQTELAEYYSKNLKINRKVLILAMEYRHIANSYLSTRKIDHIDEIQLSPLEEVNDMLRADKIQNYKDFCLYHRDSHERSHELEEYFQNWFKKLEVDIGQIGYYLKHFLNQPL